MGAGRTPASTRPAAARRSTSTSPGANTRVRSWTPTARAQFGFLVTHNESISIADYYTVRDDKGEAVYRPTCHYAYHPCDDAVLSLHELFGRAGADPAARTTSSSESEIVDGIDELGVLLYGHARNAYWYGSQLSVEETRALAPYQNATGMQVTSAVLAGMVWALENPKAGIVEADEMDFRRCLEVQTPYLGPVGRRLHRLDAARRPPGPVPRGHRRERSLAVPERAGAVGGRVWTRLGAIKGLGAFFCPSAPGSTLTNLTNRAAYAAMTRTVNLYEAKTHLSALVDAAERGEEIVIAKNGVAKARLVPIPKPARKRRPSGLMKITYIADDFDATDESVIRDFEGFD